MALPRVRQCPSQFQRQPAEVGDKCSAVRYGIEDSVGIFKQHVSDERRSARPPAIDRLLAHTRSRGHRFDVQPVEPALQH